MKTCLGRINQKAAKGRKFIYLVVVCCIAIFGFGRFYLIERQKRLALFHGSWKAAPYACTKQLVAGNDTFVDVSQLWNCKAPDSAVRKMFQVFFMHQFAASCESAYQAIIKGDTNPNSDKFRQDMNSRFLDASMNNVDGLSLIDVWGE